MFALLASFDNLEQKWRKQPISKIRLDTTQPQPRKSKVAPEGNPIHGTRGLKFRAWSLTDSCPSCIKRTFYSSDNTLTLSQGANVLWSQYVT